MFALTSTFPPNVDPLLTLSSFEVVTPETIKSPKTVAPIATTSKCFVLSWYSSTLPFSLNFAKVSPAVAPSSSTELLNIFRAPVPRSLNIVLLPSCMMEKSEEVPTLIAALSLNTNALSDWSYVISFVPLKTTSAAKSTVLLTSRAPAKVDIPVTDNWFIVATPAITASVTPIPPLDPLATPTWRS